MSSSFGIYEGSPYYYSSQPNQFIHYTSIPAAMSIIRDKAIRLYDLEGMDDRNEMLNALSSIEENIKPYKREKLRRKIHGFSMCQYKLEREGKSLSAWRNYGVDGRGLGLVFSFDRKYQPHWVNLMLSKVYYNPRSLEIFKHTEEAYQEFAAKHNFQVRNRYEHLYRLLAFHKSEIYKDEREVRLLYCAGFRDTKRYRVRPDAKSSRKYSEYLPLELEWKWKETGDWTDDIGRKIQPYIRLSKVILGYRIGTGTAYDIAKAIHGITNENCRTQPVITHSVLRENFK